METLIWSAFPPGEMSGYVLIRKDQQFWKITFFNFALPVFFVSKMLACVKYLKYIY